MAGTDDRKSRLEKSDADKLPSNFILLIQAKWQGQKNEDFGKKVATFASREVPLPNLYATFLQAKWQGERSTKMSAQDLSLCFRPPLLLPLRPQLSMTLVQAKWQGQTTERVDSKSQTLTSFRQTSFSLSKLNGRDKKNEDFGKKVALSSTPMATYPS